MSSRGGGGPIIGLVLVVFMIVFGLSFGMQSMATLDSSSDMNGSPYEEQYDMTVETNIQTMNFMGYLPYIFVLGGIILAVSVFGRRR